MATSPLTLFSSLLLFTTLLLSLQHLSASNPPLLLPLTHSHSNSNSTHLLHLLKSSSLRSAARFHHRRHHPGRPAVSLPLSPGSDYTLSLSVGPATTVDLYMDTGSDLVWFPCSPFECILCDGKPRPSSPPPPPPPDSAAVSCSHPACSAAHSSLPSSDLCAVAGCPLEALETSSCPSSASCPPFYYAYGDGSLVARLRRGRLVLPTAPHVRLPNFTFGCAHAALGEPVGVAGFGRGLLSLPAQLAALSPGLGGQFSYCLVAHSFQSSRLRRPSPLILGRVAAPALDDEPLVYTPMLHNPKHPYFYLVGLEAISVGRARVVAEPNLKSVDREGNGGLVVDSGTTFTMLPADTYTKVAAEFGRAMAALKFEPAEEVEADTGLAPCYYYNEESGRSNESRRVPGMALHFSGGATVVLPRKNYFMGFERGGRSVGCLMVMNAGVMDGDDEDSGGPAGTLGNFQQQGMEVVYDLEGRRVGFARRRCAALWDSLSRG